MNKKTISAKPRAASKAPLSPRGKASKNQTAKMPGDANDIAKMLEAMLDKKLGEIEKRIGERIEKAVDDITFEIAFANDAERRAHDGTSFLPIAAIPAIYKEATPWPRLIFNREAWPNCTCTPDKAYIMQQMQDAENCALEIGNRAPNILGDALDFLNAGQNGHFRTNIVERLLHFPRIAIDGEDVKIGALQLFEGPINANEDAALNQKARAPFDKILAATGGYLEKAEAQFPQTKEKLHAVRDKLQELAAALGVCSGVPGERKEASDAAKAAISAAREARRALQDYGPNGEIDEEYRQLRKEVDNEQKAADKNKNAPTVVDLAVKILRTRANDFPHAAALVKEKSLKTLGTYLSRIKNHDTVKPSGKAIRKPS